MAWLSEGVASLVSDNDPPQQGLKHVRPAQSVDDTAPVSDNDPPQQGLKRIRWHGPENF